MGNYENSENFENRKDTIAMKYLKKNKFVFLFFSLLILGMAGSILQKDIAFSSAENRYLTQFPTLTMTGLSDGSYMNAMERYLNDQFIGRNRWITLKTASEKTLFQKNVIEDVCIGTDSYLMNQYTYSEVDAAQITKNIDYLNGFQEKYDADVILVPSASEILTNRLMGSIDQIDFTSLLADAPITLSADTILSAHREEPIYYKTDHHWTLLGAYYVYEEFIQQLSHGSTSDSSVVGSIPSDQSASAPITSDASTPGVSPSGALAVPYDPLTVSTNFQGTVARKVGITNIWDHMEQQKSDTSFIVTYDYGNTVTDSLYVPNYLTKTDQYSYYLDGNHGVTQITNLSLSDSSPALPDAPSISQGRNTLPSEPGTGSSILIIKDSFANTFATLLCENYENVYLIDLRHYNGSIDTFIADNGIDQVLFLYSKINFMQDKNLSKLLR
ncbi:MAG: DHHW family protein [Lachnospiraceae bacterium]|nr:DHHW family protein [Lachnospiraceae bacterium]